MLQLFLLLQLMLPILHQFSHTGNFPGKCAMENADEVLCRLNAAAANTPLAAHFFTSDTGIYTVPENFMITFSGTIADLEHTSVNSACCLPDGVLSFTSPPPQFL
ncbi:hypothetical protein C1N53_04220 [Pontibacter sp. SGAir0037]|nr:hypothetical protein C1N53_04220 [Pontibacter sp. SGAir0037]